MCCWHDQYMYITRDEIRLLLHQDLFIFLFFLFIFQSEYLLSRTSRFECPICQVHQDIMYHDAGHSYTF